MVDRSLQWFAVFKVTVSLGKKQLLLVLPISSAMSHA